MSWANRHRIVYLLGLFLVISGGVYLMIRPYINKPATCFDNKQNTDEIGVDCGGSCMLYCPSQIKNPVVMWSRSFPITQSIYNSVAYLENQNPNAVSPDIEYLFRLYDSNNIQIAERKGSAILAPNGRQVIFEGGIQVGDRVPVRTSFSISNNPLWYKNTTSVASLPIRIVDIHEPTDLSNPKLTANVSNVGTNNLPGFKVAVLVTDDENNVQAVSQTLVDFVDGGKVFPIVFTWPYKFPQKPFRYILEPIINPFDFGNIKN